MLIKLFIIESVITLIFQKEVLHFLQAVLLMVFLIKVKEKGLGRDTVVSLFDPLITEPTE